MSELVKISEVMLYAGYTASVQRVFEIKKILDEAGIKYTFMNYADESAHPQLFSSLSTWWWGKQPDAKQVKFTDFPIVTWKEFYNDWTTAVYNVTSKESLYTSTLWTNKSLVS